MQQGELLAMSNPKPDICSCDEALALRAEVARLRLLIREVLADWPALHYSEAFRERCREALSPSPEPHPCYCGGDARMKVHSPSGCGLTETTARGTGGHPPWTFDADPDGGAL